jgi:CheY-like chemotaxis protein
MGIVYVLDHDLTARKALQRALPCQHFRFFESAADLQTALEEAPQQRGFVRGFLCDLSQERQNAYAFSRWLKDSLFKDLPLVWLSPRISWSELEIDLAVGGGQDCFFKPFVPLTLQHFATRHFEPLYRFEVA